MSESCFCHLHAHSAYSFLDGLAQPDALVARAAELGQPGMALTDHGVMFGAPQFFKACAKHGVKGIIGMEVYEAIPHAWDPERDGHLFKDKYDGNNPRYHHLTLWAENLEGWRNLCSLHTRSFTKDYKPKNQPLVDRASLEEFSGGVMVGLGCIASRTNFHLHHDPGTGQAYDSASWYKEVFGDRVYMEVMANLPEQQALLRDQRKLAQRLGVPVIATNDVHYRDQPDGQENGPHHVLVQARMWRKKEGEEKSGDKSDAGYGQWYGTDQFYLKSQAEMLETSGLLPDEVMRTAEVLDRVDFDFYDDRSKPVPPLAPVPTVGMEPAFDKWLVMAGT